MEKHLLMKQTYQRRILLYIVVSYLIRYNLTDIRQLFLTTYNEMILINIV